MDETARYTCPHCGEPIDLPVDASAGPHQRFTDDCPVCCNPNVIRVEFDGEGNAFASAEAE